MMHTMINECVGGNASATFIYMKHSKMKTDNYLFHSFSQHLRKNLDRNIRELFDFKTVMQTISTIQTTTVSVEIKIKEMQETFNVLKDHNIPVLFTRNVLVIADQFIIIYGLSLVSL